MALSFVLEFYKYMGLMANQPTTKFDNFIIFPKVLFDIYVNFSWAETLQDLSNYLSVRK